MKSWLEEAVCARLRGTGWQEAFVFFKHEAAGAGPKLAADFRRGLGAPRGRLRAGSGTFLMRNSRAS